MDSINKFFLIAAGVIITAGLIFLGFRMADMGTATANHVMGRFTSFMRDIEENEMMQFDGVTVAGSDVVNFMRKYLSQRTNETEEGMTVTVVKGATSISYQKYEEIKEIYNFSHASYIDPTVLFKGSVIKNENGVITEVKFEQR